MEPDGTCARCLGTVAVAAAVWSYIARVAPYEPVDLEGYFVAARATARATMPAPSQAIHSPFLVLVVSPLVELSLPQATAVWRGLSVLAYVVSLALLWWLYRSHLTSLEGAIALLAAGSLPGVFSSLRYGQVNLVVSFLIVFALACLLRGRDVLGGVVLGVSIALKPVALLLIPGFLLLSRVRFAVAATLTLGALFTGSSFLVYRGFGAGQWFRTGLLTLLGGTSGWGQSQWMASNQSLSGVLVKFSGQQDTMTPHLLGLAAGAAIGLGALALLRPHDGRTTLVSEDLLFRAGFLITATLLASPLTWPYYSSFLVLPLVATYLAVRPRGSGALAVALGIAAYFLVAHDIWHDVWPPPHVPVPLPRPMTLLTQSAQFVGIVGLFALQAILLWEARTGWRRVG